LTKGRIAGADFFTAKKYNVTPARLEPTSANLMIPFAAKIAAETANTFK